MKNKTQGFTLIEIAIVLVIIGLLLGGILKGQEMIMQGRIKNIINDMNGIAVAVPTYMERYHRLPGDDDKADTRWKVGGNPVAKGNGDGFIARGDGTLEAYNSTAGSAETRLFWQHLRLSGLINGDGADLNQPRNPFGGMTGVQNGGLGLVGLVICTANLPAKVAEAIDTQLDGSGDPARGTVRAMKQTTTNPSVPLDAGSNSSAYEDDGSSSYVLCRSV